MAEHITTLLLFSYRLKWVVGKHKTRIWMLPAIGQLRAATIQHSLRTTTQEFRRLLPGRDDDDDDDDDDDNRPVWPTWTVGALVRSVRCIHINRVWFQIPLRHWGVGKSLSGRLGGESRPPRRSNGRLRGGYFCVACSLPPPEGDRKGWSTVLITALGS
jgi:hypothetical protein